jgi:hypothetical protein
MTPHATATPRKNRAKAATQSIAALLAFALILPNFASKPVAQQPEVLIDHIEITAQYITVHFYTDPNRTYTVQGTTDPLSNQWTDLYTARALPFSSHYVYADERTNTMRFYRLFVVP